jgi:hypothetical protein
LGVEAEFANAREAALEALGEAFLEVDRARHQLSVIARISGPSPLLPELRGTLEALALALQQIAGRVERLSLSD